MALLGKLGTKVTLGALVGSLGVGAYSAINSSGKFHERKTPVFNAFSETLLGDAQADRNILGADVGFSTIFPSPFTAASTAMGKFALVNPLTFKDLRTLPYGGYPDSFTSDEARSSIPYRQAATGDIVLGAYNLRNR